VLNRANRVGGRSHESLKYKDFCCPICGSKDYDRVTENDGFIGSGGRTRFTHNVCNGCSVHFGDAEMFSKKPASNDNPRPKEGKNRWLNERKIPSAILFWFGFVGFVAFAFNFFGWVLFTVGVDEKNKKRMITQMILGFLWMATSWRYIFLSYMNLKSDLFNFL